MHQHRTVCAPRTWLILGLALVGLAGAGSIHAQTDHRALHLASSSLAPDRYTVVVDLEKNELHFVHGEQVLWSAPVGTGTGLLLDDQGEQRWEFSTPTGEYQVQFKELLPIWRAPDWYFIENKLPVPPPNDSSRLFPGGLGAAAVYIGHGLAIHGTNRPELLGQRVSHGCIRLSNAAAERLFNNVQIGTPVVIVGTPQDPSPKAPPPPAKNPWDESKGPMRSDFYNLVSRWNTPKLLEVLDEEMRTAHPESTEWAEVAGLLVARGMEDDRQALAGLVRRASEVDGPLATELNTFVANAYARSPERVLRALGSLQRAERKRAAYAIVETTMQLYPGSPEDRTAPWPTRRFHQGTAEGLARWGWSALREAEQEYREERLVEAGAGKRTAVGTSDELSVR